MKIQIKSWTLKTTDSKRLVSIDNGQRCQTAIKYDSGTIAYDYPEIVPQYIRIVVERMFAIICL